jgi:hypothetical protein
MKTNANSTTTALETRTKTYFPETEITEALMGPAPRRRYDGSMASGVFSFRPIIESAPNVNLP